MEYKTQWVHISALSNIYRITVEKKIKYFRKVGLKRVIFQVKNF